MAVCRLTLLYAACKTKPTNDLWRFDLALNPMTPLLVGVAICLAALLSQWPGLRTVNRLDIATVVRLRST